MSDNQVAVLLEDIQDNLQLLAESSSDIHRQLAAMRPVVELVPQMAKDLAATKLVVIDHSSQLSNHEQRLMTLEMPTRA